MRKQVPITEAQQARTAQDLLLAFKDKSWEAYRSAVLLENHPIFKTLAPATRAWIKATASDKPSKPQSP